MYEKLMQLQSLLIGGEDVIFLAEVELLNPVPDEYELNKFQDQFPGVVKAIKEIKRIGICF